MIHESFERANMITIMPVPKSKYCIKLRGLKQKCKNKKKKKETDPQWKTRTIFICYYLVKHRWIFPN